MYSVPLYKHGAWYSIEFTTVQRYSVVRFEGPRGRQREGQGFISNDNIFGFFFFFFQPLAGRYD